MKKLLILYFLLTGLVLQAKAQTTYFSFDSIWSPPYICQASEFKVEVLGTRTRISVMDSTQYYFISNDTVYVRFNFVDNGGLLPPPPPLHRQILIPAPPIGQYKIVVQGFIKGFLHTTITSKLSVCSGIAAVKDLKPDPEVLLASIFPNPATDRLHINFPDQKLQILTATVSDITGKTYVTRTFSTEAKQLNIEALPQGVYLLTLETEKGRTVRKIFKN